MEGREHCPEAGTSSQDVKMHRRQPIGSAGEKSLPGSGAGQAQAVRRGTGPSDILKKANGGRASKSRENGAWDMGASGRVKSLSTLATIGWVRNQHLIKRKPPLGSLGPCEVGLEWGQTSSAWVNQRSSLAEFELGTENEKKTQKERNGKWQINTMQLSGSTEMKTWAR